MFWHYKAEENPGPGIRRLVDRPMKAVQPFITSIGLPYLQMTLVGGSRKERRKRMGRDLLNGRRPVALRAMGCRQKGFMLV